MHWFHSINFRCIFPVFFFRLRFSELTSFRWKKCAREIVFLAFFFHSRYRSACSIETCLTLTIDFRSLLFYKHHQAPRKYIADHLWFIYGAIVWTFNQPIKLVTIGFFTWYLLSFIKYMQDNRHVLNTELIQTKSGAFVRWNHNFLFSPLAI